ncbi:MAG: F-box protein [Endozoicomonadaceae bacterium]|nr:F-box protein [Endozoicomonadaceae bacterium]
MMPVAPFKTSECNKKSCAQVESTESLSIEGQHANRAVAPLDNQSPLRCTQYKSLTQPEAGFKHAVYETIGGNNKSGNNWINRAGGSPTSLTIENLPSELLSKIFLYLDSLLEVDPCCLVNKRWRNIIGCKHGIRSLVYYDDSHRGRRKNTKPTDVEIFNSNTYSWIYEFSPTAANRMKYFYNKKHRYFGKILFFTISMLLSKSTNFQVCLVSENRFNPAISALLFFRSYGSHSLISLDYTNVEDFQKSVIDIYQDEKRITFVSLSDDSKSFLTISKNGLVQFWNNFEKKWTLIECNNIKKSSDSSQNKLGVNVGCFGVEDRAYCGDLSLDGNHAVILSDLGNISFYEFKDKNIWNETECIEFDCELSKVIFSVDCMCYREDFSARHRWRSISISTDGKRVVAVIQDVVKIWHSVNKIWKQQSCFKFNPSVTISSMAVLYYADFNYNGRHIITIKKTNDKLCRAIILKYNNEWNNIACITSENLVMASFSPDGNHIAVLFNSASNCFVKLFKLINSKRLMVEAHIDFGGELDARTLQFSPDSTQIRVHFPSFFPSTSSCKTWKLVAGDSKKPVLYLEELFPSTVIELSNDKLLKRTI